MSALARENRCENRLPDGDRSPVEVIQGGGRAAARGSDAGEGVHGAPRVHHAYGQIACSLPFEMRSTGWILGYHGCDAVTGEAVLRGDVPLKPSDNDYDWLGTGIYFWEGDPKRALDWAHFAKENPKVCKAKIREPFVLGAIIDPGHCLDLLEAASVDLVRMAHTSLVSQYEELGWGKPENEGKHDSGQRKLDCAVINFLHEVRESETGERPFDSVRALFPEGDELYAGAGFQEKTHVQLAVRSEASIIAYFRPRFGRL